MSSNFNKEKYKYYIGKKMIEDGLMAKVINPKQIDGVLICKIGEHWFYFGGSEYENEDPKNIPFDILVEEIKNVLDDFFEDWDFYETEYKYYYFYLCENI